MRFVVLPGDGIGPEISDATVRVLEVLNRKLGLGISFETHEIGLSRHAKDGSTFPIQVRRALAPTGAGQLTITVIREIRDAVFTLPGHQVPP